MTYAIQPTMGVNITDASTSSPVFAPGTKIIMSDGGESIYVKASAAITAGDVLQITPSTGAATGLTRALAADDTTTAALMIGVAHVSIASGEYGWACLRGIPTAGINVAASCVKGRPLYTTTTAGQVDDATASEHLINGMMLTATATGAAVTAGILSNPVLARGTPGT